MPNDTDLVAQTDSEKGIAFYPSYTPCSFNMFNFLKINVSPTFYFLELNELYHANFGLLAL